jgi:hypothetical protein
MKILSFLLVWLLPSGGAWACAWCRPRVQAGIHNAAYSANLALVLLPVAVLLALGVGLFYWDRLRPHFALSRAAA